MDDEQVQAIRETSRNVLYYNRRKQKEEETDTRRCIEIASTNVTKIADKLKTKAAISSEELQMLKNALFVDQKNVETMLDTHGALRGLVRELSGNNVLKQCAAAGCLCNLSRGDNKTCSAVAKAASVYLVAALDNLTEELAVTCAWTVGNLCSCSKVCEMLVAQGAVTKLSGAVLRGADMRDAAVYALRRILFTMQDHFMAEHLHKITECLPPVLTQETLHLMFLISCHKDFQLFTEATTMEIIEKFVLSIKNSNISEIKYLSRTLANIYNKQVYEVLINSLLQSNVVENLKVLLLRVELSKDLLWLFGNVLGLCGENSD